MRQPVHEQVSVSAETIARETRTRREQGEPNVMSHIADGKVDLVINIPKNFQEEEVTNDYLVRRQAVDFGVPLVTNLQLAKRLVETLQGKGMKDLKIKSWEEY